MLLPLFPFFPKFWYNDLSNHPGSSCTAIFKCPFSSKFTLSSTYQDLLIPHEKCILNSMFHCLSLYDCSSSSYHHLILYSFDEFLSVTRRSHILNYKVQRLYSIQFSCSVMSDSLWPHELQKARPPCPSPTPRVHPNPCPLSWWCHPTISSSVIPFSSCPQSFPASGSSNESALRIRWPKYWSFNFNISPTKWTPRTDLL